MQNFPAIVGGISVVSIDKNVKQLYKRPKILYDIQDLTGVRIRSVPTVFIKTGDVMSVLSGQEAFKWLLSVTEESQSTRKSDDTLNPMTSSPTSRLAAERGVAEQTMSLLPSNNSSGNFTNIFGSEPPPLKFEVHEDFDPEIEDACARLESTKKLSKSDYDRALADREEQDKMFRTMQKE